MIPDSIRTRPVDPVIGSTLIGLSSNSIDPGVDATENVLRLAMIGSKSVIM